MKLGGVQTQQTHGNLHLMRANFALAKDDHLAFERPLAQRDEHCRPVGFAMGAHAHEFLCESRRSAVLRVEK